MNSKYSLEKFLPTFGSEILDELYKETAIIDSTFDDFLNLPVREDYKPSEKTNIEESKTEKKEPTIELGFVDSKLEE